MKSKNLIIGVDLGGTKIHSGLVKGNTVVQEYSGLTPYSNQTEVLQAINKSIDWVYNTNIIGIGIGFPGVVDTEDGKIMDSTNIPTLNNTNLKDILEQKYKIPVYINNDANCFVVGEKHFGLGKYYSNIVGLTLGTGLGGGVIFNDKLYSGKNCGAAEIGSIKFKNHNLEYYCSSEFFEKVHYTTGKEIFLRAKIGDTEAIKILEEYGENIGEAVHTIILAYDPEIIIFGGSISLASQFFKSTIFKALKTFPNQHIIHRLKIAFSQESNAAILGAAALFYDNKL